MHYICRVKRLAFSSKIETTKQCTFSTLLFNMQRPKIWNLWYYAAKKRVMFYCFYISSYKQILRHLFRHTRYLLLVASSKKIRFTFYWKKSSRIWKEMLILDVLINIYKQSNSSILSQKKKFVEKVIFSTADTFVYYNYFFLIEYTLSI